MLKCGQHVVNLLPKHVVVIFFGINFQVFPFQFEMNTSDFPLLLHHSRLSLNLPLHNIYTLESHSRMFMHNPLAVKKAPSLYIKQENWVFLTDLYLLYIYNYIFFIICKL